MTYSDGSAVPQSVLARLNNQKPEEEQEDPKSDKKNTKKGKKAQKVNAAAKKEVKEVAKTLPSLASDSKQPTRPTLVSATGGKKNIPRPMGPTAPSDAGIQQQIAALLGNGGAGSQQRVGNPQQDILEMIGGAMSGTSNMGIMGGTPDLSSLLYNTQNSQGPNSSDTSMPSYQTA